MTIGAFTREEELDQLIDSELGRNKEFILAFLVEDSQSSKAARQSLVDALSTHPDSRVFTVDVKSARNVAARYQVTAAPTVVRVNGCQILDRLVGPQPSAAYAALMKPPVSLKAATNVASKQPTVKVYVTNSCPWCRKLETYLDRNRIKYTKVNVETDPTAAFEMSNKSGQLGVPQSDIGGTMVIGFDLARISKLLQLPA
jgi:glutaredoxin-like YruB-family protein